MKAITFLLHTKQPILLTSLQGDPNSDVSFAYIPGSVIRGVLISRYIQRHNIGRNDDILNDEQFPDVGRLFFNGETRFLNGYLYSKQKEKRTLPVPLSWLKKKGDDISKSKFDLQEMLIYDFSCQQPDDDSYKSLDAGFCIVKDKDILLYQEKRRINIHNMRNRKKGRGIDGDGAVFRYDALDVGQVFQCIILCNNDDDVEEIKSLLQPENLWLGGSISAGYGQVEIKDIQECDDWCEVGIEPDDRDFENEENLIRITLLSDLILRDEYGNYVLTPPKQIFEELLEVKLCLKSSFIGNHIVGGFNKKWGLPLPQIPALSAGSVFVFECDRDDINIDKIRHLKERGIGERRVDGFGRVAVNWLDDYSTFTATLPTEDIESISPQLAENSEDSKIAIIMAERLLQQKLDRRLLEKVTSIKLKPNKLSNSQLSRLMIVARQSLTEQNNTAIIKFLDKLPKNAKSQFEETKIYGKTLNTQIGEWLKDPNSWIDSHHVEISIAGKQVSPKVVEKLKAEYTRLLIIAVAKQAIKQQQKI